MSSSLLLKYVWPSCLDRKIPFVSLTKQGGKREKGNKTPYHVEGIGHAQWEDLSIQSTDQRWHGVLAPCAGTYVLPHVQCGQTFMPSFLFLKAVRPDQPTHSLRVRRAVPRDRQIFHLLWCWQAVGATCCVTCMLNVVQGARPVRPSPCSSQIWGPGVEHGPTQSSGLSDFVVPPWGAVH